jgi:primosomal protein N' (replication factor Y)
MAKLKLIQAEASSAVQISEQQPYALIVVNHGNSEIEDQYTYLVPEHLSEKAKIGAKVSVNFNGRRTTGYIWARSDESPANLPPAGLKAIEKVIASTLLTSELQKILPKLVEYYGGNYQSLLKTLIPELGTTTSSFDFPHPLKNETKPKFHFLPLNRGRNFATKYFIEQNLTAKSTLVFFFPTVNEILQAEQEILSIFNIKPKIFHGTLPNKKKQEVYQDLSTDKIKILLTTRSGVFLPFPSKSKIFIYNEEDFSNQEMQFPYWNLRELILNRKEYFEINFLGTLPSLALISAINRKEIAIAKGYQELKNRVAFNYSQDMEFKAMQKALNKGRVLVVVPEKGMITAISCQKCRNFAKCNCGGRIVSNESSKAFPFQCTLCAKPFPKFECAECKGTTIRALGKGSDQIALELGKTFPGKTVSAYQSDRDNLSEILVCTYTDHPNGEFSAIFFNEIERVLSGAKLDAEEMAFLNLYSFFQVLSLSGDPYLEIDPEAPLARYLIRTKPIDYLNQLLEERRSLKFPPFYNIGVISGKVEVLKVLFETIVGLNRFDEPALIVNEKTAEIWIRSASEKRIELSQYLFNLRKVLRAKGETEIKTRII